MDRVEDRLQLRGRDLLLATVILLLAAVLRWYGLAELDMWTDEVQTLWISVSSDPPDNPLHRLAPVNYWLTGIAVGLLGENELGVRFVPWLAGVATIGVYLWSTTRWFGCRVALLGGLFLTLSMWHVGWSQTGRQLALQTLLVLAALHFFLVAWIDRRPWASLASVGLFVLGVFTHGSTVFYLAAILAFLGTGWLAAMAGEAERKPGVWLKTAIPFGLALAVCLFAFIGVGPPLIAGGQEWNRPWNIVGSLLFYLPPWVLLPALAGALVLAARRQFHVGVLLAFLCLVPPAFVTLMSVFTIASAAYCLASLPALAILVGIAGEWLIEAAPEGFQRKAAVALISGFFLSQGMALAHYYTVYNGLKPRWKEVSEFVEHQRLEEERFFAAEGDVAQFYLGRGNASWLSAGSLDSDPEEGAWFAVYTHASPYTGVAGRQYRSLHSVADLVQVFPLYYGAKDRTLAVFHIPLRSEHDDDW